MAEIETLKQLLPTAEFIAIDLEFTGLNPYQDTMPRYFDPIELRFQYAKDVADAFSVIQLGLCVFNHTRDGILSAVPMSFMIRPSTGIFSCQTTSIRFLVEDGGFDFNELFRNGFPSGTSGRQIMTMISESKIPLVMHNGLLDLMFLIKNFFEPIGETLPAFKEQCKRIFPTVFDSKLICSKSEHLRGTFGCFWLEKVFQHVNTDEQFMDLPPIRIPDGYDDTSKQHDAAFDAYMTGVVFARARNCIQHASPKARSPTESWLVENVDWRAVDINSFANRICLNRCIQHLDLAAGNVPSFRGVLKISVLESSPIRVRTPHILDVLKPVIRQDRIKLLWDDQRTAFAILGVSFHDRLQWIASTVNNATKIVGFTVEPYYDHPVVGLRWRRKLARSGIRKRLCRDSMSCATPELDVSQSFIDLENDVAGVLEYAAKAVNLMAAVNEDSVHQSAAIWKSFVEQVEALRSNLISMVMSCPKPIDYDHTELYLAYADLLSHSKQTSLIHERLLRLKLFTSSL